MGEDDSRGYWKKQSCKQHGISDGTLWTSSLLLLCVNVIWNK